MNIYMENAGLAKNKQFLESILKRISTDEPIDLYMKSNRITTLASLFLLVFKSPQIRFLELDIDINKVTLDLIYAAKHAHGFFIRFHAAGPISNLKWRMIRTLKGNIYIDDFSGGLNTWRYQSDKRILYNDSIAQVLRKCNLYSTAAGRPGMECEFTSCLGRNICISAEGNISFCPKHPEQSFLGSVMSEGNPFENDNFKECLTNMIRKRKSCKESCKWFGVCNGGCVYKADCQQQKENLNTAFTEIENIIINRKSLEGLPVYLEQAVLYKLFVNRKH